MKGRKEGPPLAEPFIAHWLYPKSELEQHTKKTERGAASRQTAQGRARPTGAGRRDPLNLPIKPACVTVSVTVARTVGTRGVRTVASASRVQGGELLVPPDVRRETPLLNVKVLESMTHIVE